MVQTYYWLMVGADSSSMANQLLEIAQGVYQGTLPTVLSWIVDWIFDNLITFDELLDETCDNLAYLLVLNHVENMLQWTKL